MSDSQTAGHRIGDGMEVTLHFTLKLEDGTELDSTRDKSPATFQVGDGNLPPGFERHLKGMGAGQSDTFEVSPEHGFGQHNPQNVQTMSRDQFESETPEEGMVMSFSDVGGGELPGVIKSVDENQVEVDFNHPLAGRTLTFEVEILEVKPATTH